MTAVDRDFLRYHTPSVTPWPVGPCARCGADRHPDAKVCADCKGKRNRDYTAGAEWMREGLCAEVGGDYWFPAKGEPSAIAKSICADCPVAAACLEYAITNRLDDGIWGGLGPVERARVRQNRKGAA